MNKTFDVVILGGGIGGLSAAHELVMQGVTNILVIEKNDGVGGQARSSTVPNTKLPTEYCSRIYGAHYDTLRRIFKEIPTETGTVSDNLVNRNTYVSADKTFVNTFGNSLFGNFSSVVKQVPFSQKFQVINRIAYGLTSCKKRFETFQEITWGDYLRQGKKFDTALEDAAIRNTGPFLGVDLYKTSASSVLQIIEGVPILGRDGVSVMNNPTSDAWFTPWQTFLESKGVTFWLQDSVTRLFLLDNNLESVRTASGQHVTANMWISNLPPQVFATLLPSSLSLSQRLGQVYHTMRQDMVSVQLYFKEPIRFPNSDTWLWISDSPWQLIIEPQGEIWKKDNFGHHIQDVWSVGICDPLTPGNVYHKPWTACTPDEIIDEVWTQIQMSALPVDPSSFVMGKLWEGYRWAGKEETEEPKFSPNATSWKMRPFVTSGLENVLIAHVTVNTNGSEMLLMDNAARAGVLAAQTITKNVAKRVVPGKYKRPYSILLAPVRALDHVLFKAGVKSPILPAGGSVFLLTAYGILVVTLLILLIKRVAKK